MRGAARARRSRELAISVARPPRLVSIGAPAEFFESVNLDYPTCLATIQSPDPKPMAITARRTHSWGTRWARREPA